MVDKDFNLMVGLRIREAREAMHMSREKFSELCDISESFLAAVESGRKGITTKTVYKICSATYLSPDYLVMGRSHGFETDVLLELIGGLEEREREHAIQIVSAYVQSVRELSEDKDKNQQEK